MQCHFVINYSCVGKTSTFAACCNNQKDTNARVLPVCLRKSVFGLTILRK